MNLIHRAPLKSILFALAVAAIACVAGCMTPIHDAAPSRRADVEIIRRDQLGVSSFDDGRIRIFWTASDVEPGQVGYRDLGPLLRFAYDELSAGASFGLHRHENVEIITIILEGSFNHEDTAGRRGRVNAGEVGLTSAGSGIQHSEAGSADAQTRLATIRLRPRTANAPPSHMTARPLDHEDGWRLIAAERNAPLIVDQDARILMRSLAPREQTRVAAGPGRLAYVAVVEGEAVADGHHLSVPERILVRNGEIAIVSDAGATIVVVDVPAVDN